MKKIVLLVLLSAILFSCKNSEEKKTEKEEIPTENIAAQQARAYKGDYIDSNGALVLMGANFIYGVAHNEMAKTLSKQVAGIKKNDSDMVGVVVKGTVSKNTGTDTEWEEILTITEILRVDNKPSEADIKFEETAKKS